MPTYEYACKKCGKTFTMVLSISEHDELSSLLKTHDVAAMAKAEQPAKCPSCGSFDVNQQLGSFFAKTSRKS